MSKSTKITYSELFEKHVFEKAIELESKGLTEGFLDNTPFKEWKVFLNKVPKMSIYRVTLGKGSPFLAGITICVGSD